MTETLAIVLASNLALILGAYWLLRLKPGLLGRPVEVAPMAVSLNGSDPVPEYTRPFKMCMFCDEAISLKARRCPHCTSNLPMQS